MKFEISVKIYREEKYIRKRKFSSLKKIIRLLYDSSSPNHDFQFISFNLQFYPITLIIFRALEIPSSPLEEERKLVPIRSSHFFLPFFFFFPFLFHLYIQLLVLAHLFLFVLTASRTERRVIIFLFCWHSANIVSHFLGTKRSYHLLYLLFSRRTIFPF